MREQRRLETDGGVVDLSHRGVLSVTGPDRLTWLHSLTTQHLTALPPASGHDDPGAVPAGSRRARAVRGGRRSDLLGAHRARRGARPGRLAGADAVHDAGRGGGPHRGVRRRLVHRDRSPESGWPGRAWTPWAGRRPSCPARTSVRPSRRLHGPAPGRWRPGASRPASRGSGWIPTIAPFPTRSACWTSRSIWRRGATAGRKPWPGCTPSADRRAGWCGCTWTAAWTRCPYPAPR